jgi:hypothetical protein
MLAKVGFGDVWNAEKAKDIQISQHVRCHTDTIYGRVFVKFIIERKPMASSSIVMWIYSVKLSTCNGNNEENENEKKEEEEVNFPLTRVTKLAECDITTLFKEAFIDFTTRPKKM